MRGRLAALVAITATCFGIFAGGLSAIDSTLSARDRWFADGRLADLEVSFQATPQQLPDFSSVTGVEAWRARTLLMGQADVADSPHLSLELVGGAVDGDVGINKLVLLEGAYLDASDTDGVLIDWHLQDAHHVAVGDELPVTVADKVTTLTVRGVVRDAEFLLAPANPSLFVPTKGSLGIGFVTTATIERIEGVVPVNSVLVRTSPGADIADVRQSLLRLAADSGLQQAYALAPAEQFSSLYLEKNLAAFATVVPVIVGVTGLSAVFVTFFLLAQWLTRERRALGVLMTLGYTTDRLARAFLVVLALLAVLSAGLGVAVAYGLARLFVWKFAVSVGLPIAETYLTCRLVWTGAAAIAVVFASAAVFAAVQVRHMTPLDAMRTVSGTERMPGRLSSWLGLRLPTSWLRVAVRNTVRDKAVSILTVLSMALGFGITASFVIAFSSVISTAQAQVDAGTWDLLADFRTPVSADRCAAVATAAGAADSTCVVKGAVQATAGDVHANLYVGGYDPAKPWYTIPKLLEGHDVIDGDTSGVLLEVATARQLGVGLGDSVGLDSTSGHFDAHVVGIFSSALPGEARFTVLFAQQVFALDGQFTGVLVQTPTGELQTVSDRLQADDSVQQVLTRLRMKSEITALSDQITSILVIGSGVAIVVALLFVMACLGYTVLKRSPDYQLLRTLGFRNWVVAATILTETGILGVLAVLLAIPVGAATAHYTGWRISAVWFHINTTLTVWDYAQVLVPALVLLPIVALPMARAVSVKSLDEFMRSRDVG